MKEVKIIDINTYITKDSPRNYPDGDTVKRCTQCKLNYLGYEYTVMCNVCIKKPRGMFFELDAEPEI